MTRDSAAEGEPLVSVVTATYNWSGVLRFAIESVRRQTFSAWEHLVIGDACSDDSAEVVAACGDPRVRWHNLAANSGSQSAPNNAGIAVARGRYVAYLGHDDLWHPRHLAILVERIEAGGCDGVHSLAEIILPSGERQVSGLSAAEDHELGTDDFVVPSSLLHRRSLVEEVGAWADYREIELPPDAEWQQRARRAGAVFRGVSELTAFKFPSSARPGSYAERPTHEQALYSRRMREEPDFQLREATAILRSNLMHGPRPLRSPTPPAHAPKGWIVRQLRQIRGLLPDEPEMPALPEEVTAALLPLDVRGVPRRMGCGQTCDVEVEVANRSGVALSSAPPHPVHLSYRWHAGDGGVVVIDGVRSVLLPPLPPGERQRYPARVESPPRPGRYVLRIYLVQEGVRWLDDDGRGAGRAWKVEVG